MNRFEEEYKNRFKGQESLNGIDADDIWEGIAENLEQSVPTPKRPIMQLRNIALVTTIFILLFWGFCKKYNTDKENIAEINNEFLPSNDIQINPDVRPNTNQVLSTQHVENEQPSAKNSTIKQALTNAKTVAPKVGSRDIDLLKHKNLAPSENTNSLAGQNNNQGSNFSHAIILEDHKNTASKNNLQNDNLTNFKTRDMLSPDFEKVSLLPSLPILPLANQSAQPVFSKIQYQHSKKSPQTNQFQIAVYAGVNTMHTYFKDKNNHPALWEELTASNNPQLGRSASFRFSWLRNGKYSLGSGIDVDYIRVKFQTVKEAETTVLQDGYLTDFDLDPQTGDTINQVYETVSLRAMKRRSVLQHNNFKLISIPFEIGVQHQKGKLGFGLNLGISANFFISQKGKTLNGDREIQTIDDSVSDELPFRKFSLSYQLNPFIDYDISNRIKLRLSPVVRYQAHGVSDLYGLGQNSLFTGVNGGLVLEL